MWGGGKTFVALFDCGVYGVFDMVCVWMMVLFTEGTELVKTEDKYWEILCSYQGLNENKTKQNPLIMKYYIKLMVQILWVICLICLKYGFRCMINCEPAELRLTLLTPSLKAHVQCSMNLKEASLISSQYLTSDSVTWGVTVHHELRLTGDTQSAPQCTLLCLWVLIHVNRQLWS